MPSRRDLPVGTVTFLRTDVEGSMACMRALGAAWDDENARHLAIIRAAVAAHDGVVVRTEGDALFAAFGEAGAALDAAIDAQRGLNATSGGEPDAIRVRIGLHSGEAHLAGDDYGGFEVNRSARVAAAAHGGQIILSETARALVEGRLPDGVTLVDLGSHHLRDVPRPERMSQVDVPGLPNSFPPPRTGGRVAGNIGERLTPFVGRHDELRSIAALTERARLVTLHGPGGIGKTSLATEVARQIAPRFEDGAWFVPLAEVDDPADVSAAIAHAIGIFDGPERTAASALLPYLAGRSLLLVLDNFEHLVDGAQAVTAIVRGAPACQVIVTSRAPLHVSGEHEVPVAPLADDAVTLFMDRARAVRPGWEPGAAGPVVNEICRLLDHLPLGIELAAARIALLSPEVIRDRLAARLPLPGRGTRDAPARQRTLEGTVAWSHDLLEPELQVLLQDLGVFEGGFDLDQVREVAPSSDPRRDRLDDLLELADRSLIVAVPDTHERVRFRLLRTIQSFALDQLAATGREAAVRRRHAEVFAALGAASHPHLNTSRHAATLDRMEPDMANLRAADRWAIETEEGDLALRLVADQWRFWHAFGLMQEGRTMTETVLAMSSASPPSVARAWAAAAAGSLAYWQADTATAKARYEEQIRLARVVGDERCLADGLFNMAHVAFAAEDDEAVQLAFIDDVIARFRALGDERTEARAAWARGVLAMGNGRPHEALATLEAGLEAFERFDDPQYRAMTISSIGWAAFSLGDVPKAIACAIEGIQATLAMRDLGTTTISLHVGVLIGVMVGRLEEAAVLYGAFDALCERYGVRPPAALGRFIKNSDPFLAVRTGLPRDVFEAAYERGRRLSLDAAVALVLDLGQDVGPAEAQ